MGSVFKNPTAKPKRAHYSERKQNYLATKKTDRKKVVKHEQEMQIELCRWLRQTFPGLHFRSDTGSGSFSSAHEKDIHNKQQSSKSEPDLMIFAARHGYHGLLIELKAEGVSLKMKRDGTNEKIYKDAKGKIVERDYKIRLKGDWKDLHIERQAQCLQDYRENWGYFATFGVGLESCKEIICRYFSVPYEKNAELPF